MRRRLRTVALVVAMGLGTTQLALAQVEQVPLTWNAPSGCPTAASVLADVERNLADSGEPRAPFLAVVNVSGPKGGLWHSSLRVEARGGYVERRFEAETCQAIAAAAALIIALSAESGSGPGVSPPPAPRPIQLSDAGPPPIQDAEPEDRWHGPRLSAAVNELIDAGTMPSVPALGLEATIGIGWVSTVWRLRLLVGAGFFPPQVVTVSSYEGSFWLLIVSARSCLTAGGRLEIGLCLGGELDAMHSGDNGSVSAPAATGTQYWLSPAASTVASWSVSPGVAVFGRAEAVVPGTRRNFHPDNIEGLDIYTVPAMAFRGAVGFEMRFY